MRQTINRQRPDARLPIAETLWIIAGSVLLLALGDVVILVALALAAAAIATAWWIRRAAGHRALRDDVALAAVSHLPAGHRGPAHTPWPRRSAA